MADQGIKKVIVSKSSLPPAGKDGEYLVRYRIVSEDKNRYSHWSPIYKVFAKTLPENFNPQNNGTIEKVGSIVMVAWNMFENTSLYDIFVKYDNDTNYVYHGSSVTNSYSILKEINKNTIHIAVQLGRVIKEEVANNTVYAGTLSLV